MFLVRSDAMPNEINKIKDWLPYKNIYENGIIKLKDNSYVKIIKILPINFNLKTDFEKEQILNSYKIFLKTCNFDIQILIQSKKEDLSQNIKNIQKTLKKENKKIIKIGENYINYIKQINKQNESSSKNFYILIKKSNINTKIENKEEIIFQELNENYFKIKDSLTRCGNNVINITTKIEIEEILQSFLNKREYINNL